MTTTAAAAHAEALARAMAAPLPTRPPRQVIYRHVYPGGPIRPVPHIECGGPACPACAIEQELDERNER